MKADLSHGEARPAINNDDEGMATREPRRRRVPRRHRIKLRWAKFDDDEVFCMLSILHEQNRRHQFNRGIEPERTLLAELERECRRRGIVDEDD